MQVPPLPDYPTVTIAGSAKRFPVHRIYCVGWNYAAHVREMGLSLERDLPVFFMKPLDAIVPSGGRVPYPPRTQSLHYEVELVVAIGRAGAEIGVEDALEHVWGYGIGIDMTRRDLQIRAKELRQPWETAKAFDHAAPLSALHGTDEIGHPASGRIWLAVNGELRQDGDLGQQIWTVPEIVQQLSSYFTLEPGDLIYTGTPAGVGAVERGDVLEGGIDDIDTIRIEIV